MAYTALADALSHMWTELAPAQILRVVEVYCRVLHNPGLIITAHTAAIRLLHTLVEVLPTKMQGAEVARVLNLILETVADRMEVGCVMHGDALARLTAATKEGEGVMTIDQIEKSRPVQVPIYATERPDLVVHSESAPRSFRVLSCLTGG
jgi:transformation/transcription domain-associated protein